MNFAFLDDEPEGGPSCYFILTGFNSTEMFKQLAQVQLKADALIRIVSSNDPIPNIYMQGIK